MDSPEALFSIKVPAELLDYIDRRIEQKLAAINTPAEPSTPVFYSRKEVAKILCISVQTVSRHVLRGIIKSRRVGTRVLFSLDDITEALQRESKKRSE